MENENVKKSIEKFLATEKVYHYTSFEAACKIISSKRLKFGVVNKTNDINEVHRKIGFPMGTEIALESVEEEMSRYKQLSFVNDNSPRCGYNIPAMWGHYAQKGNGVCLVFDKSKLMARLSPNMVEQEVKYNESFNEHILVEKDVRGFFERNKKKIFFKKTKDWSYEQEWRILARFEQQTTYLPFEDSLMAIITNNVSDIDQCKNIFSSENVVLLKKIAPEIPILNHALWFSDPVLADDNGNDWSKQKNWDFDVENLG